MTPWQPAAPWIAPALAFAVSAAALAALLRVRRRLPQDHPTGRSLHDRPVARVGGIAIWAGFVAAALLEAGASAKAPTWLAAWGAVTAISVADDWRGVNPALRLAVHATAAVALCAGLWWSDDASGLPPRSLLPVTGAALVVVWSANLYNFMDGNDGLAALMAIFGFGAYGIAAAAAGAPAGLNFALAAATIPFLAVNLPPARAFMGDGGSVPLGFLAAAFGFAGIRSGAWPPWFPLLVFLPFVADATVTVIRRVATGNHLFVAHRTHYYQRVHRLGAGHRGTLLLYGVLIAGTTVSALAMLAAAPTAGWTALGAWTAAIAALFAGIDHRWAQRCPGVQ